MRQTDPGAAIRKLTAMNGSAPSNGSDGTVDSTESIEDTRPRIDAKRGDLPQLNRECWDALKNYNVPPTLFIDSVGPIRLEPDPITSDIRPVVLTEDRFQFELGLAAHWFINVKAGDSTIPVDSAPKAPIVKNLLASRSVPFPVLERIVNAPVFGADGSLQTTPGYHESNRTYFSGGFSIRPIPDRPSDGEVIEAFDLLIGDLLVDFPFVNASDATHAVGELLLPFARAMIPGPCPLHIHEAPMQGTGKDLLAEIMCQVVTGADPVTLNYSSKSEEFEKRLVSTLRSMPEHVVIPNVTGRVDNEDLTDAISRGVYYSRLLGTSTMLKLPARNTWTLTSNNAQLTPDMARRSIRIRMDAKMERPEQRQTFRHAELKTWIGEHRGDLVWSCLTMIQSWLAAGRPAGQEALGGFSQWARVIGGIVAHIGCVGFLADRDEFIARADSGSEDERAFVALWWERFASVPQGVAALYPLAVDENINLPIDAPTAQGSRVKLGIRLRQMRDRQYRVSDSKLVSVRDRGVSQRATLWKLEVEPGESR